MLPAWATVVVALGGAAIGAIAGVTGSYFTLRGARINIEHSEREACEPRLIQASEEFLFGNDSPADSAARLTTFSYMRAYAALDEQSMDLAGRQFSEAGTAAREFLSAANEAILPSTAMHR